MQKSHLFRIGMLLLLLVPCGAAAETTIEWDFSNKQFQRDWQVSGNPSFEATQEGLIIFANDKTLFGRSIDPQNRIEVISLDYKTEEAIEGWIYWHVPGSEEEDLMRVPLLFSPTEGVGNVSVNMTEYKKRIHADFVGIGMPTGSALLIQNITLMSWNPGEKLIEALKSFWTFDQRKPSSVNFLWGPHIVFNPRARELLFTVTAPTEESANRYFYLVMILGIVWGFIKIRKRPASKKKVLTTLFMMMAVLWVFYDFRMGSEFFGYMQRDYRTYWSRPIGERTFRERSYFNDFAAGITPLVQDSEKYIFTAPHRWPFLGLVRYYTYPSVPTHPFQEEERVDTWVVYKRPDIQINNRGELENEGIILSTPGKILHEFEEGSFIFREQS